MLIKSNATLFVLTFVSDVVVDIITDDIEEEKTVIILVFSSFC